MNKITVVGRLTTDVEMEETSSGVVYCKFRLASRSKTKDADGNARTDFYMCTAWRQIAELLNKYTKKGNQIVAFGSLSSRQYDDNGTKRTVWEMTVEDIEFVASGENNGAEREESAVTKPKNKTAPKVKVADLVPLGDDEELPF